MTRHQFEVWHFIYSYLACNMRPPRQREIAEHFGVTRVAITLTINRLIWKGYLKRKYRSWRSLTIARMPDRETWRQYAADFVTDGRA